MKAFLILYTDDGYQLAEREIKLPNGLSPFKGLVFSDDYNEYQVTEVDVPIRKKKHNYDYEVILTLRNNSSLGLNEEPLQKLGWHISTRPRTA